MTVALLAIDLAYCFIVFATFLFGPSECLALLLLLITTMGLLVAVPTMLAQ